MRVFYDLDYYQTPVVYYRNVQRYAVIAVSDEDGQRVYTIDNGKKTYRCTSLTLDREVDPDAVEQAIETVKTAQANYRRVRDEHNRKKSSDAEIVFKLF